MTDDDDIELIPGLVSTWKFDDDDDEILSHSTVLREKEINSLKSRVEVLGLKMRVGDLTAKIMKGADNDDSKQEEKGTWVTSNGQHIFIPDGADKGDTVKKHFDDISKKDTTQKKPSYTDKEKRTLDLANKIFSVMTTNKDYEQFVGMVDKIRNEMPSELIAELDAHLDEKFTKKDFTNWKKSGKDQKFTVTGFVSKARADVIKNAWNDLPDGDRKLLKGFKVKTSKARSSFAAGSFNRKTDVMTINIHVTDNPSNMQKNFYENIAHHEAGHARWHNKYTSEQKEQWKKKVDEEGLHNTTSYSSSFFQKVKGYEREIRALEHKRDFYKLSHPNIAKDAQRNIDAYEKVIPHFRDLAYNETHSEVYGYMNRPTEGDRTFLKHVNKDKVKKGSEILNEVFGK